MNRKTSTGCLKTAKNKKGYVKVNGGFGKSVPPELQVVIIYFLEKGQETTSALAYFDFYGKKDWKTGAGRLLSNWKKYAWEWILQYG